VGVYFDVNQQPADRDDETLAVYKDGPITGILYEQEHLAPAGTRLEGHLWTSGDRIHGRYLWALVPGKGRLPVCLEIGTLGALGIEKQEGSKPGAALGWKWGGAIPVQRWR
jgi:serine/threonine-protein kinase